MHLQSSSHVPNWPKLVQAKCLHLLLALAGAASVVQERQGTVTPLTDGVFQRRELVTVEAAGARCAVPADFDGDGDMDLVSVSSNDNTVAWYERLDDGSYGPKRMISRMSNGARIVTVGDIDQDGIIDVIVASYYDHTVGWFKNLGGSFGDMQMISRTAINAQGVSVADLDNDGDLDVISGSSGDNTIAWYENLGEGRFCEVKRIVDPNSRGIRTVVAADLDNDGFLDLAAAAKDAGTIMWYRNDGSANFVAQPAIDAQATGAYSLVAQDVDDDGKVDLVTAANAEGKENNANGMGGKISFFRNGAGGVAGQFTKVPVTAASDYDWFALSVWAGDLDGDGDVDIASASFGLLHPGGFSWYENTDGSGNSWTRHSIFTTPSYKTGHYIFGADMDGDGDTDLVGVTNGDNKVQILYASTGCDNSTMSPRAACCRPDEYWDVTASTCAPCTLGTYKSGATCQPCSTTCPRLGLGFLPATCHSVPGCGNASVDMASCDCGQNRFLSKSLGVCETCADGQVTPEGSLRTVANHTMVAMSFLDGTKYYISDMAWPGFDQSRCHVPDCQEGGTYYNMTSQQCEDCGAGTYSSGGQVTECLRCTAGSYCPPKTRLPVGCLPGSYSEPGAGHCTLCEPGHVSDSAEQVECKPCALGMYQPGRGQTACLRCAVGAYGDTLGRSACTSCQEPPRMLDGARTGTREGADRGQLIQGATSSSDCGCPTGMYELEGGLQCAPCGEGVECLGFGPPLVAPGYFMEPTSSRGARQLDVWKCISQTACPGQRNLSTDPVCGEGFDPETLNCGRCLPGYYKDGESCSECSGDGMLLPFALVGAFLAVGAAHWMWTRRAAHSEALERVLGPVTFGITMSFMQSLGLIGNLSMAWPEEFQTLLSVFSIFLFDAQVLRTGCIYREALAGAYLSKLAIPLAFLCVMAAWTAISLVLNRVSRGAVRSFDLPGIGNTIGMFAQALYISLCTSTVSLLECYSSPNGEATLQGYPYAKCGDSEYNAMIPFLVLAFIFYVFGILLGMVYLVYVAPERFHNKSFRTAARFLFFKFRPDTWWWGIVISLRSLFFALVPVIEPNDGHIQCFLMLMLTTWFLALQENYKPFLDRYANILETVELACLIVILTLGSWFIDDRDFSDPYNRDLGNILSILCCLCVATCFCFVIGIFFFALWQAAYPERAAKMHDREVKALASCFAEIATVAASQEKDELEDIMSKGSYIDRRIVQLASNFVGIAGLGMQPRRYFDRRVNFEESTVVNNADMQRHVKRSTQKLVQRSRTVLGPEGAGELDCPADEDMRMHVQQESAWRSRMSAVTAATDSKGSP